MQNENEWGTGWHTSSWKLSDLYHDNHKPWRPQPWRPQTMTATNHDGHKPRQPQTMTATTMTATNHDGHKPWWPQTTTATNHDGHKPRRPQTTTATNHDGHKPWRPQLCFLKTVWPWILREFGNFLEVCSCFFTFSLLWPSWFVAVMV